jgi:hypothetical protein
LSLPTKQNAVQPDPFKGESKKFKVWRCQVEAYLGSCKLGSYVMAHLVGFYNFIPTAFFMMEYKDPLKHFEAEKDTT